MNQSPPTNVSPPIIVGISGASGSVLASATIDRLLALERRVIAVASSAARIVWREEMDESFGEALERWADNGAFTHYTKRRPGRPHCQRYVPDVGDGRRALQRRFVGGHRSRSVRQPPTPDRRRLPQGAPQPGAGPTRDAPQRNPSGEHGVPLTLGCDDTHAQPAFYLRPKNIGDVVEFIVQRTLLALGVIDSLPQQMRYDGRSR